jgi:hypothetical protein
VWFKAEDGRKGRFSGHDEGRWDCMAGVGAWERGGTDGWGFASALYGVGGPVVVFYGIASRWPFFFFFFFHLRDIHADTADTLLFCSPR